MSNRTLLQLLAGAVILMTGCSDKQEPDTSQPLSGPFPYTLQNWDCGEWITLESPLDSEPFYCWPEGDLLFGSQVCKKCKSNRIVEIRTNREKILLIEDFNKTDCTKHEWIKGISGAAYATPSIRAGDAAVIYWENHLYIYWIQYIEDDGISFKWISISKDQFTQSTKLFWNTLSWQKHQAKDYFICNEKLQVPFHVHYHLNKIVLTIRYPLRYGELWDDDENTPYYIAVIREEDIDKNQIDLSHYRFKLWQDGMGDKR